MMIISKILDLIIANPKKDLSIMVEMLLDLADLLIIITRGKIGIMITEIWETKIGMLETNFESFDDRINKFLYVCMIYIHKQPE